MRVFGLADAERAYYSVGLPRIMWEHFEKALLGVAKETRTTGKNSQLNHFKGHVRQIAPELGYEMKELEWLVLCEAMARGWPTRKAATSDGVVVEVPADPHKEVDKGKFGLLIDILHEIAFHNDIVLNEEGTSDERSTAGSATHSREEAGQQVSDSRGLGEGGEGGGASPLSPPQHQAESKEVSHAR